jgi:hypothetical protein
MIGVKVDNMDWGSELKSDEMINYQFIHPAFLSMNGSITFIHSFMNLSICYHSSLITKFLSNRCKPISGCTTLITLER